MKKTEMKFSITGFRQELNIWTFAAAEINGKRFTIQFVRFDDPSQFGIDKGRVSKLWAKDEQIGTTIMNYDRGWDILPATAEAKAILRKIKKEFN